jgi:hypothetical protein
LVGVDFPHEEDVLSVEAVGAIRYGEGDKESESQVVESGWNESEVVEV